MARHRRGTGGLTPQTTWIEQAQAVLGTDSVDGDVELIAAVLAGRDRDADVAVVSDDRTVRTTAAGFGATVTGTIGVLVRAVADGTLDEPTAIALVRDLDTHGLHMTAELRATAEELIADAAPDGEE